MPAKVADINDARSMWARWRYLSMMERKVALLSDAAVPKVRRAFDCAGMRKLTDKAATGSSPVLSTPSASGGRSNDACGLLTSKLRPNQRRRSV